NLCPGEAPAGWHRSEPCRRRRAAVAWPDVRHALPGLVHAPGRTDDAGRDHPLVRDAASGLGPERHERRSCRRAWSAPGVQPADGRPGSESSPVAALRNGGLPWQHDLPGQFRRPAPRPRCSLGTRQLRSESGDEMMWHTLLDLALVMSKLSLTALAGSGTIVGELGRETVAHGWMTSQQFTAAYALSQLAPGPGSLVVIPIGYQAAGLPGALVALAAFICPTALIAAGAVAAWGRLRGAPWAQTGRTALMPVAIVLILGSVYTLARTSLNCPAVVVIGLVAFLVIWRTRVPTVAVVLGGIVLGVISSAA